MPIRPEWTITFRKWCEVHDKALDWLIISFGESGIDRQISRLYFNKYMLELESISKKLAKVAKEGILNG